MSCEPNKRSRRTDKENERSITRLANRISRQWEAVFGHGWHNHSRAALFAGGSRSKPLATHCPLPRVRPHHASAIESPLTMLPSAIKRRRGVDSFPRNCSSAPVGRCPPWRCPRGVPPLGGAPVGGVFRGKVFPVGILRRAVFALTVEPFEVRPKSGTRALSARFGEIPTFAIGTRCQDDTLIQCRVYWLLVRSSNSRPRLRSLS